MKAKANNLLCVLLAFGIVVGCLFCGRRLAGRVLFMAYPQKYTDSVNRWAEEYELDPLLIYAVIHTESGFDAKAESYVGARGLMQITETTFDWIQPKLSKTDSLVFSDLYDPETNIHFGCCYFMLCMGRYGGDVSTSAAAYHSGWGTVDKLLARSDCSSDGKTLTAFPYPQMRNYVSKVNRAYQIYQNLYYTEGEIIR